MRASLVLALQYRLEFLVEGLVEMAWTATALVPLLVVYTRRQMVGDFSYGEALVVVGWFVFLRAVLEGVINPSITTVVEHVRKGTLDFVLLKPADAQFLISTARFQPWRALNVLTAVGIFTAAFRELGRWPSIGEVALSLWLLGCAAITLYSIWILTVSAAFVAVRVDNLTFLFGSIFDAARWPGSVFRGALWWVFTLVVPIIVMTTFPAEALLGRWTLSHVAISMLMATVLSVAARRVWMASLARYTSAGG